MPFDSTVHVIDDDEALRDSLTFLLRTARIDVQAIPLGRRPRQRSDCLILLRRGSLRYSEVFPCQADMSDDKPRCLRPTT
jgi:hypothetical protein